MKIITGGAGFIGSAICWRLNSLGIEDILIVDTDLEGIKKNNTANLKFKDFVDKDSFLKRVVNNSFYSKLDTVYHMGACSSTTEENMEFLKANNFEYSKEVGKWSLKNGIRFIYASSAATYGNGEHGFEDNHELIPLLKPLNKYGLSKQMFDMWVLENKYENKFAGIKYFNVFGPNENHKGEMRSMVNKAYHQIKETGRMKLFKSYKPEYNDGEQRRDFLYVKDAVEMTIYFDAIEGAGRDFTGIYNVGSGNAYTWNELANAIFKAMNKEVTIEYVDMPDNIKEQYQYYSKAELIKLRDSGYRVDITELERGVEDYIVNYLSKDRYLFPKGQLAM